MSDEEQTYKIRRFYKDYTKPTETVQTGLTLEEAKEHCSDPASRTDEWFEGYDKE